MTKDTIDKKSADPHS